MSRCDFKVVLLGQEYVGKTSLVLRYANDFFSADIPYQTTIGAAFCSKMITFEGQNYSLGIWDTAGSERFEAMASQYYRGAHAAVICYDPRLKQSWRRLLHWLGEVRKNEPSCKVYLVATKKDLLGKNGENREVPLESVLRVADAHAGHFAVSSKTGEGIDAVFQKIGEDCASDAELMKEVARHREQLVQLYGPPSAAPAADATKPKCAC